ncbi:aminoacylase-1-like [Lineus longissimus]|uniref:aminoacylase-1-like n=1 Tax=Lineus longissimus TaxID=88925 RepID=UPI002B4E6A45
MSDQDTKFYETAVANFIEYLRINTVQPEPDYDGAIVFLKKMASELDLPVEVIHVTPKHPAVIITWEGTDPLLPSVMLNSHIDVVPVFPEHWICDPFEAMKDEKGDIYARGSQDMKCVAIQYIEAVRKLKREGRRLRRTIHMTFVPDEEVGGHQGMEKMIKFDSFKKLKVGFAMDEGLANETDEFMAYYGERSPWWFVVTCPGAPGHGSRFVENTAAEKAQKVINSFLGFRDREEKRLKSDPDIALGDVTTTNMTMLKGGVQPNVIPAEFKIGFDMRIAPTVNLVELEKQIHQWCKEAGDDVSFEFLQRNMNQKVTDTTDSNPWWKAFSDSCKKMNLKIKPTIFPAATDSRYLREADYPAIGFSPMNNTPVLLHDHNEFLNEKVFTRGIDIYYQLIPDLANV